MYSTIGIRRRLIQPHVRVDPSETSETGTPPGPLPCSGYRFAGRVAYLATGDRFGRFGEYQARVMARVRTKLRRDNIYNVTSLSGTNC